MVNGEHHVQATSGPATPMRRRTLIPGGTLTLVGVSASANPNPIPPNAIAHRRSRTAVTWALIAMAAKGDLGTVTEPTCAY
jgi:hypothetical protein